ncbi:uncharacterized protein MAM_05714 [Metarhizium album ARSEF 1941]|uniref:Uncharacterized protein n=1 Tax=Metarhizium album (strain ARSEF 1941) TaxID=1081103 RepID=A0A0B2WU30_METAS|nr:uncharacterized protein MAM_05714 [Metarhizium album ARSEF 1941]KHN96425.1 hypothetical protein MAM_05714 [Metarhizium album ARSEF 1941]
MTSKPELRLSTTMPAANPDADAKRPRSELRSPRFREDFDAPFSEALLNASTMTLATETDTSPLSQHPGDMSITKPAHSPRPPQSREDSWSSTNSSRSATSASPGVNDRIKEWARKSFMARRRSDDGESSRSS